MERLTERQREKRDLKLNEEIVRNFILWQFCFLYWRKKKYFQWFLALHSQKILWKLLNYSCVVFSIVNMHVRTNVYMINNLCFRITSLSVERRIRSIQNLKNKFLFHLFWSVIWVGKKYLKYNCHWLHVCFSGICALRWRRKS